MFVRRRSVGRLRASVDDVGYEITVRVAPLQRPLRLGILQQPSELALRQLWYVDVSIDPGDAFWPFVRLAVARYQPDSVPGHHLSVPVLCDYVQLTPERTASVSRTDVHHVRVVVSGPVGIRQGQHHGTVALARTAASVHDLVAANRKVVARLQRRDPLLPTDLGWETVAVTDLVIRGSGSSAAALSARSGFAPRSAGS